MRRALWLHTDVLVQGDVGPLYRTPLRGAPAAAVEDCAHTVSDALNASHVALAGAVQPTACLFNSGVMVIDLLQAPPHISPYLPIAPLVIDLLQARPAPPSPSHELAPSSP